MYVFNSYGHQESHAKCHCNRLTTVQDIQDYVSLIFWGHIVYMYKMLKYWSH